MIQVNIHEAKTTFSALLKHVSAGEKVVICNNGVPVADLVAHVAEQPKPRIPGRLKGKIWMAPDFDEFGPELEEMFYGHYPNDPLNEYMNKSKDD